MSDYDTGVAVVPATRPSTFSPFGYASGVMLGRPAAAIDTGVATTPAALSNVFDDVSNIPVVADPGNTLSN